LAFELVRVDDRLIHGQVTVAWGSWLNPDRIILVNDEVAGCDWRCELYAGSDALGVPVTILTRDAFAEALGKGEWDDERAFLIVESPGDLLDLITDGLKVPEANIGGMHHAEGKRELLPYVFVDDSDVEAMKEIMRLGTKLEARDVPQAQSRDIAELLGEQ
jgi:mannose/fructose/N-acetylgalactosamine-specific phosphotransferase system component IIB